ncbi:MAG: CheA signal transduction histidine kinase [Polyangiaceae bacterium]|jgi:two-component system chemotaxis sensor kinase CheA|nr:CheA signal transduction histidine kinase [Polyangiaceae bacterium]
MPEITDKAREEFFSEAQEIIETLSRNLLALDAAQKAGKEDPSLINEAFRAVHTLKGLAGLFGAIRLGAFSHRLEDLLDDLRLGRMDLRPEVLDVLFSTVDAYGRILTIEKEGRDDDLPSVDDLFHRLDRLGAAVERGVSPVGDYELDPGMLAVLTEYEEHRLRANIEQNLKLYRLRVQFDLSTIDKALDDMKERAKRHGEIITYLPTGEATGADAIELDLLVASRDDLATLIGSLGADNVVIEEIPRRRGGSVSPSVGPLRGSVTGAISSPKAADAMLMDREGPAEQGPSLRSLTQTVRVDIRKLDHLMNIVGELSIVRSSLSRIAERLRGEGSRQLATELMRLHRNFDRRLGEMQDGILEVRMVPLGQVFDRLARVVRQISRDLNKEIRLVITGAETEIDKLIVEELSDPLMHMIRNAIDHGIESAERRAEVGKPLAGTIALNAFQKGNHVMIEVEDDGRGIDESALVEKAVASGKIARGEASELVRDEILALIFVPGLSTREQADDLSGRGVGMDIVKTNINKLGGVIDVHSESGIGTKMAITLPITLAIVSALLVRVHEQVFAIPLSTVSEALSFDAAQVRRVENREVITVRGSSLPICDLGRLLGLPEPLEERRRRFVVVAALGNRRLGLVVDHLFGQEDIVIKPLGSSLSRVRGFAGATELGDQRVGLVLDSGAVIEEVLSGGEGPRERLSLLHG